MKVSTPAALAIIGAVVLAAAGIGYYQIQETVESEKPKPAFDARLPFHTEEEWTVLQVSQFLADLGGVASGRDVSPAPVSLRRVSHANDIGRYELEGRNAKATLSVRPGVWNPATYASWEKAVLSAAPDAAAPDVATLDCAKTLLDPRLDTFLAENKRISDFLTAHPASAAGHLQAALLMGTLALNDYACIFRDARIPLNRLTAHLAMADALGMPGSDPGRRLAESIRLTLCGQQSDALASLGPKPAEAEGAPAQWDAVLRLRNTLDWRDGRAAAAAGSTALKYEYFRALAYAVDAAAAAKFLEETGLEPNVTCWRIANEVPLSVENGHVFSKPILNLELAEIARAAEAFGVPVAKDGFGWLKEYLDTPEGSPVAANGQIQVAGRNFFAGYHQRHFFEGASQMFHFLNDMWSVPEGVSELRGFLDKQVPTLRYKPFLERIIARNDRQRQAANAVCEAVIFAHPEMVTPGLWLSLQSDQSGHHVLSAPDFHAWFHPEIPQATAFEAGDRIVRIGVGNETDAAWLKTLWERAPYSYAIAMQNAFIENKNTYSRLRVDVAEKWLGPLADYDLHAMRRIAACEEGDPALYRKAMEKAAALDPDLYLQLGQYLDGRGLADQAAAAYLQAFEKANDRVAMANVSLPLVKYLYAHGQVDQAAKVAGEAAEVYSYRGLEAYVWLLEQQGSWKSALEMARKIDERYNDLPNAELACLIRYREAFPGQAKDQESDAKLAGFFPDGLKKVTIADFSGPPTQGALIKGSSAALANFGLRNQWVIVALNGYRTDTFPQYMIIRGLADDPKISVIAWDGSSYREFSGTLPNRRFGVEMVDYHGR